MTSLNVLKPGDSEPQFQGLILGCRHGIQQCTDLLQQLSETSFTQSENGSSFIGAHLRHVLERYQCFFAGLQSGCVDYDGRKRDKSIETNLEAATFALVSVAKRIDDLKAGASGPLQVRESVHLLSPQVLLDSSVNRELMGLITHTTHHLAIIALLARGQGYRLPDDFGKAPSTILHERS
jgi:uncharacterized damage-inducible protein DinB